MWNISSNDVEHAKESIKARPRLPQHHDGPVVSPNLSNPAGGPPQCRAGVHHNHIFELFRRFAEAVEQRRKPQPTQTVYAPGSMEWFAAKQSRLNHCAAPPLLSTAGNRGGR